jgi:hypothetical protein
MYGGRQLRMGYDGEASEFAGDVVPDLDPIPEEAVGKAEVLRALHYCRQEGLTTLTDIIKLTTRGHTPHGVKSLTKAKQTPYVQQRCQWAGAGRQRLPRHWPGACWRTKRHPT